MDVKIALKWESVGLMCVGANHYTAVVVDALGEEHEVRLRTDSAGEGLWVDGTQVEGTAQFSAGRNVAAAYRRWLKRRYSYD